ncbi:MAG: hypothetical protein FWD52_04965, partial [Candidatus Bathyarchaeota archaeon]|nr:hypothetical protein [Candidatus Termiticorpusculum sp.]
MEATGGDEAAGIGGGGGSGIEGVVEISDGTVTAIGGSGGAGIGGSCLSSGGFVTISGGVVEATGYDGGAGIGGGDGCDGGIITISGGVVTANGAFSGAGIGGGNRGDSGAITISGGTVNAIGGYGGAGVGGGYGGGGFVTISGGVVEATGGIEAAGIGGGYGVTGGFITISGGTVTTTGYGGGAGVGGGGYGGDSGDILIYGENTEVAAKSMGGGACIGAGHDGTEGNVFVLLPKNKLTEIDSDVIGSDVVFSANPVSTSGIVTVGLPAPFDENLLNVLTGLGPVASGQEKVFSVITTFTTESVHFALPGYGLSAQSANTGTKLKTPIAVVEFVGLAGAQAFIVTGDTGYSYDGPALTIKESGTYTISMTNPGSTTTTDYIIVESGVTANIILNGVKINLAGGGCAFLVEADAIVSVILEDVNEFVSGGQRAGLEVSPGAFLEISDVSSGSLTATGGDDGAGIGGGFNSGSGVITISGGTVVANGASGAAGIGGGHYGDGVFVTISGGYVEATGGVTAAGIGGGYGGTDVFVTISGGTITATNAGERGTGIGGGDYSGSTGNILIYGENTVVTAKGTDGAVDIGVTNAGDVGNVFVLLPRGKLIGTAGIIGDDVVFSANPASTTGIVTVELPAPFDVTIDVLTGLGPVPVGSGGAKVFSVITTFADVDIHFTLPEYTLSAQSANTGTKLKTQVAVVEFVGLAGAQDFIVTGDTNGYSYVGPVLTITASGDYTISMATPGSTTTTDYIIVESGVTANIILNGVKINLYSSLVVDDGLCAFLVESGAVVTVTLEGENSLTSDLNHAGLEVPVGASVVIDETISGGSLTATGGKFGAGIGGGIGVGGGSITILGGTVNAIATEGSGAGIGGGGGSTGGSGGVITISGGTVTATGADISGAGIGGGYLADGGVITISGGTVTATGNTRGPAYSGSAGIGGGGGGGAGNILIYGESTVVTAKGMDGAADIGAGNGGTGGNVFVLLPKNQLTGTSSNIGNDVRFSVVPKYVGGVVTVELPDPFDENLLDVLTGLGPDPVSSDGAKVFSVITNLDPSCEIIFDLPGHELADGSVETVADLLADGAFVMFNIIKDFTVDTEVVDGYSYDGPVLTIEKDGVYTISMTNPGFTTLTDYIVIDSGVTDATVILNGVKIDLNGVSGGCAFLVEAGAVVTVTLEGENSLRSAGGRAGLEVPVGASVVIDEASSGSSLTARGGQYGAGIGGGQNSGGGDITILGGTVNAYGGGNGGAGIGGGQSGSGGVISISSGTTTATGVGGGAGIGGGGSGGGGGVISISGGTTTATGGYGGAGIGGGFNSGSGGVISISGGTVTATGSISLSGGSAGIGGGYSGSAGDILIYGENTAVSARGTGGAGNIGVGFTGSGGNVFVLLPKGQLTDASGVIGNDVTFSANPASTDGIVTATLPTPFNKPIEITTGLDHAPVGQIGGKVFSIITTFTTDTITFTLQDNNNQYSLHPNSAKTGTELVTTNAIVTFYIPRSVIYNVNGGIPDTGPTTETDIETGQHTLLQTPKPEHAQVGGVNVVFVGWSETQITEILGVTDTGMLSYVTTTVMVGTTENVVVYAVWGYDTVGDGEADVTKDSYSISYNVGAGSGGPA